MLGGGFVPPGETPTQVHGCREFGAPRVEPHLPAGFRVLGVWGLGFRGLGV